MASAGPPGPDAFDPPATLPPPGPEALAGPVVLAAPLPLPLPLEAPGPVVLGEVVLDVVGVAGWVGGVAVEVEGARVVVEGVVVVGGAEVVDVEAEVDGVEEVVDVVVGALVGHRRSASEATVAAPLATSLLSDESTPDRFPASSVSVVAARATAAQLPADSAEETEFN